MSVSSEKSRHFFVMRVVFYIIHFLKPTIFRCCVSFKEDCFRCFCLCPYLSPATKLERWVMGVKVSAELWDIIEDKHGGLLGFLS